MPSRRLGCITVKARLSKPGQAEPTLRLGSSFPSKAFLYGPLDDVVLYLFAQFHKVSRIPSHPDNDVLVLIRFFLSSQQGLVIQHIDLDVIASLGKVGPKDTLKFLKLL